MADFEKTLAESTTRGSNSIPGCVLAAVDQNGDKFYSKASGYDSVAADASEIKQDGVFWIASCTKLIGTIAALQCVERGQVSLDEPVERILPELAKLNIIKPSEVATAPASQKFILEPSTKKITLRQLLSHTSGLSLDVNYSLIQSWRSSRQENVLALSGKLMDAYLVPLLFEPGDGWAYSGGIDLACEAVARLNKVPLEEYLQEHVFGPLGMSSTTFRLERHPELANRRVKTTKRTEAGILEEATCLWPEHAPEDCAGAGLYSTSDDYAKVLSELIRDKPTVLKPETISLMFAPQLERGSQAMRDLHNYPMAHAITGTKDANNAINFGLGGLYIEEDVGNHKKDSLIWGGLPNLFWFANRARGTGAFYASQVLPPGDPKSIQLSQEFIKYIHRTKQL
ncbi:hypothetical protein ACEPPN_000961 [Leptodophora sp. 'Broadleaf-Isolate-01']